MSTYWIVQLAILAFAIVMLRRESKSKKHKAEIDEARNGGYYDAILQVNHILCEMVDRSDSTCPAKVHISLMKEFFNDEMSSEAFNRLRDIEDSIKRSRKVIAQRGAGL